VLAAGDALCCTRRNVPVGSRENGGIQTTGVVWLVAWSADCDAHDCSPMSFVLLLVVDPLETVER
jgi:hypothetical protein